MATSSGDMSIAVRLSADGSKYFAELRKAGQAVESFSGQVQRETARVGQGVAQATLSAKQHAQALRMLPAQMTDIAVGLTTGQAPMMVLLQQGGQIKDMFGGIVPAAKALGGAVVALVNPFTVGAVAAGGLAVALYQGRQEIHEFNRAITLTGNAAGVTSGQMQMMAANTSAVVGTQSQAAAVMTRMVGSGKVAGSELQRLTATALRWERVGGAAAEETTRQFAELGAAPVQASLKLNESVNYLTASTYAQIKSLQEQGRMTEAARLAQVAWADELDRRAPEMAKQIDNIKMPLLGIEEAAKKAWDALMGFGREAGPEAVLKQLREQLAAAQTFDSAAPAAVRRRQEADPDWASSTEAQERMRELIRLQQRYVDALAGRARAESEAAAAEKRRIDQINFVTSAEQRALRRANDPLGAALGLGFGEEERQVDDEAIARQLRADRNRRAAEYMAAQSQLQNLQKGWQLDVDGMSMGSQARSSLAGRQQIESSYEQQRQAAERDRRRGQLSEGDYQAELQRIRSFQSQALASYDEAQRRMAVKRSEWQTGAARAIADFSENAADHAANTERLLSGTFDGLTVATREWVKGNKEAFEEVGQAFADMLLDMVIRQTIMAPLLGLAGSYLPGGSNYQTTPTTGYNSQNSFDSGAMNSILSGPRAGGGGTLANRLYEVNEKGPELYEHDGRQYLMTGSKGGRVTPLEPGGNLFGGAAARAPVNNFNFYGAPAEPRIEQRENDSGGMDVSVFFDGQIASAVGRRGSASNKVLRTHGLRPALIERG